MTSLTEASEKVSGKGSRENQTSRPWAKYAVSGLWLECPEDNLEQMAEGPQESEEISSTQGEDTKPPTGR